MRTAMPPMPALGGSLNGGFQLPLAWAYATAPRPSSSSVTSARVATRRCLGMVRPLYRIFDAMPAAAAARAKSDGCDVTPCPQVARSVTRAAVDGQFLAARGSPDRRARRRRPAAVSLSRAWHGDVGRVIDRRARRLAAPGAVVAPPLAVRRERDVDLDGGMRVQRIVRARSEQQHAERDARVGDEGRRPLGGPG